MFKIIKHQEQIFLPQIVQQLIIGIAAAVEREAQRFGDSRDHICDFVGRNQGNEENAICESVEDLPGRCQSQSRFANSPRANHVQQATTYEEEAKRKSDWFTQKTDEVFGGEFKGFEFALDDDKKVFYSPGDANEMLKVQKNPSTFIQKFLDENGLLKDAVGYHRSLAIAMNPEKLAKFFYEQGKAIATEDVIRKTKNVNMTTRNAPEVTSKGGMQIRAVNPSTGNGLKIRSKK